MDDIQEIVVENPEFESESIVYPKKSKEELKEMKKPVSNANKKGKVKGLQIDNIVVVYKDEIGKLSREKLSVTIPATDKDWIAAMARKMISVEFDEQNILPQQILMVSLPNKEPQAVDYPADFLTKPITQLSKREVVAAAIYHKLRTVAGALSYDEEEMQKSLWRHILNRDTKYGDDPVVKPLTDSCYVPEIK
jgi:hypothetical protein